jgi:glycerol-1-phosphate dehydrogenase [NAD(P)+]
MKHMERRTNQSRIRTRPAGPADVGSTADLTLEDYPLVSVSAVADDEGEILDQFRAWVTESGCSRPVVVSSRHGEVLAAGIDPAVTTVMPLRTADQTWSRQLVETVTEAQADSVLAIGGGRCLDLAKLAAAQAGVPMLAVPTQLSHDGICSPVAVVPDRKGVTRSLAAVAPAAAFFSIPTLVRSPLRSIRAGLGDLMTNPFALRDWELAADRSLDEIHPGAWHLSMESYELVDAYMDGLDETQARDPHFVGLLAYALANSGLAMMRAGSSRPASGAEHKISHAIDLHFGGRALHGEQVAFASIIAAALHGWEVGPVARRAAALQLPHHPSHLRLSHPELARAIVLAPETRPGRWTVLERADLSEEEALHLVTSLWGRA